MPEISFPVDGGTGRGYLAVPAGSAGPEGPGGAAEPGPWPGVVVIHEAFGLNDDIRAKADQFAARGYLALAPDLYDGRPWLRCVRGAFRQLRAGSGPAFTRAGGGARLPGRPGTTAPGGPASSGSAWAAAFALLCAPSGGFAAAAVNYGEVPRDAESALRGACPIVGSYGARDPMGTKHPERLRARAHRPGDPARREGVPGFGAPLHDRGVGRGRGAGQVRPDGLSGVGRGGRVAAHLRVLRRASRRVTGRRTTSEYRPFWPRQRCGVHHYGLMTRPLIGITSEMAAAGWDDRVREAVLLPASYAWALQQAGCVPVLLPPAAARRRGPRGPARRGGVLRRRRHRRPAPRRAAA